MKIKSLLLCLLLFSLTKKTFAQIDYTKTQEYLNANRYWPISSYGAISFFDGTAILDTSALSSGSEAFSAICHPVTGKLLFYSNGMQLYNAKHQLMLNGAVGSYNPNVDDRTIVNQGTFAYSALIVPYVGDSNLYYHFHYSKNVRSNNKVLYSIIDMRLDGGLGGVVDGKKNITIDSTTALGEGLNVLMGDNCDLWLVALEIDPGHFSFGSSYLRAYHITANGISPQPVISKMETRNFWTYLTSSSDRKLIVNTGNLSNGIEVLKFNGTTGEFASQYVLPVQYGQIFGGTVNSTVLNAAFSPDNSKLYVDKGDANFQTFLVDNVELLQFDLSKEHPDSIFNSLKKISLGSEKYVVGMRPYNDSIYILMYDQFDINNMSLRSKISMGMVTNLNGSVESVEYYPSFLSNNRTLNSNRLNYEAIYPNQFFIQSIDTQLCAKELEVLSSDAEGVAFLWNDGSTGKEMTITESGTYWVQSRKHYQHCFTYVADTFHVNFLLSPEEPIISVNEFELSTAIQSDATYQWILNGTDINGATDNKYTVTQNGNYQVRVTSTLSGACSVTSTVYTVNNHTHINSLVSNSVRVYPNPVSDIINIETTEDIKVELLDVTGRVVMSSSEKKINVQKMANGYYQLMIYNLEEKLLYSTKLIKK